jgi:glutaredoxin 3
MHDFLFCFLDLQMDSKQNTAQGTSQPQETRQVQETTPDNSTVSALDELLYDNGYRVANVEPDIATFSIVVFSKTYCPYCDRVKKLFHKLGVVNPTIRELDACADESQIQAALERKTKQKTVPNVFIAGHHVS